MRRWLVLFGSVCAVIAGFYGAGSARAETAAQIFAIDNCVGDHSSVRLSWIGVDPGASELSLDLSYLDNGFTSGTFRSSGAMPGGPGSVTWDNLPAGRTYFVRLNQTIQGQQEASPTYFFKTCSTSTTPSEPASVAASTAPVSYGGNIDCRYQTCLVDSTAAGTIITVPSLEYCANRPAECPPRYYYEPMNGQIMVYPNITPSIYASVTFQNGQFVPNLVGPAGTVRCKDGFYTYGGPSTCTSHGGVTP